LPALQWRAGQLGSTRALFSKSRRGSQGTPTSSFQAQLTPSSGAGTPAARRAFREGAASMHGSFSARPFAFPLGPHPAPPAGGGAAAPMLERVDSAGDLARLASAKGASALEGDEASLLARGNGTLSARPILPPSSSHVGRQGAAPPAPPAPPRVSRLNSAAPPTREQGSPQGARSQRRRPTITSGRSSRFCAAPPLKASIPWSHWGH